MTQAATAKIKTVDLKLELIDVSKSKLMLRLWRYAFIIVRGSKKSKKGFIIYVGKRTDKGDTEALGGFIVTKSVLKSPESLAEKLAEQGDDFLTTYAGDVAEALITYIKAWNELLVKKELEKILSIPPLEGGVSCWWNEASGMIFPNNYLPGGMDGVVEEIIREGKEFEHIISYISKRFSPNIAELLEVVMTVSLTLRQVNRAEGLIHNRPVWAVIVADPSTYKTTTLSLLKDSKYVVTAQNFTPASLLPANRDVPPLITMMHNRVFIIPTLSEETADKETAKKVFAALESVYDGEYVKATGVSGHRREYVDTVIVAAVTPNVWEWVLPYIVNIGSRWLVYRYELRADEALTLQERLEVMEKEWSALRAVTSKHLDFMLDSISDKDLKNVIIPQEFSEDLKVLAKLVAKLRAVWRIETYWEEDEATGKRKPIKEVEVVQVEAPGRAYQQLKNFARANTLLRKSKVNKVVGLPVVDEHAMRLAAKLAICSTTNKLRELILYLAKSQISDNELSYKKVASALGIGVASVDRLMKVLYHPKVDLIDDYWQIKEPYLKVLKKYVLGDGGEESA